MEKSSQSRSVGNIISPLRYVGKKYLSSRSDVYKETLDVVVKADNIFRDVVRKQSNYLKEMKKEKGKLEAVRFAQDAAAFIREQAVLIELVGQIRTKFAEVVNIAPDQLKNIEYYISTEIGKKPDYDPNQVVEKKIDVENQWEMERPSSISRWLERFTKGPEDWSRLEGESSESDKTAIEKHPELISEAFLASWFWGRTESGKELKKGFDTIHNGLTRMFEANLSTLKLLDGLRSQGDAQAYWNTCKGKSGFGANFKKFFDGENFQKAWTKFEEFMFQSKNEEEGVTSEPETETPTEVMEEVVDYTPEDIKYRVDESEDEDEKFRV